MPYRVIEVLKTGRYRLPNGRWFESTREGNARICRQANAQLAEQIRHPLAWMHNPAAEPVTLSHPQKPTHAEEWLAKGYFAEPVKYHHDPKTGSVLAKVLVHDEADARQFDKVKQVSPALYAGWTDERGKRWPEMTILHIAATPKPIQRDISDTRRYPATFLSQPARPGAIQLSFPAHPRSAPMAEDYDDKEMDTETEGGDNAGLIKSIVENAKKLDIHGMEDVNDLKSLDIAFKAAVHTMIGDHDESGGDEYGEGDEEGGDGMEGVEDAPAPVIMSHPAFGRLAKYEMGERNAKLKKHFDRGAITKTHYEKLHKDLNAVSLSNPAVLFEKDGAFKGGKFDLILETLDQLPDGKLAKRPGQVNLGHDVEGVANPHAEDTARREAAAVAAVREHMAKKKAAK